jgi:hypothetical protein
MSISFITLDDPGESGKQGPRVRRPGPRSLVLVIALSLIVALSASTILLAVRQGHPQRGGAGPAPVSYESRSDLSAVPEETNSLDLSLGAGIKASLAVLSLSFSHGSGNATWLIFNASGAQPGVRYGLLGGSCNPPTTAYYWADGIADAAGDLRLAATDLQFPAASPRYWVRLQVEAGQVDLGGVKGPLVSGRPVPLAPQQSAC